MPTLTCRCGGYLKTLCMTTLKDRTGDKNKGLDNSGQQKWGQRDGWASQLRGKNHASMERRAALMVASSQDGGNVAHSPSFFSLSVLDTGVGLSGGEVASLCMHVLGLRAKATGDPNDASKGLTHRTSSLPRHPRLPSVCTTAQRRNRRPNAWREASR